MGLKIEGELINLLYIFGCLIRDETVCLLFFDNIPAFNRGHEVWCFISKEHAGCW